MSREAASPRPQAAAARLPLTAGIVFGIAGLFTFLASQIFVIAAAAVWAIGGYLHLGLTGFEVLGGLVGLPAAYVCWQVLRMAIDAERDPANN